MIERNKPWDTAERAVDAAKRTIKAAQGDVDRAKDKPEREAARKRVAEGDKQLLEAEAKQEGLVQYYEVELDRKSVHLTHEGIAAAQDAAGVGSFYVGANMEWPHLMEQALRAHVVYEKNKDYVVERGQKGEMEIVIVDEFTGRKMAGRQWSDGLHQACEAKERVPIKQETQTLATITLQNFFKLYRALSGMTGTAQTEAEEFSKIYQLDVVSIPTNRPVIRQDNEDRVYRTEQEKWTAILDEIKEVSALGRPVLVGTTSVEKSEMLSQMLKRKYGIDHEVLNAKNHEREAQIVAIAGQQHSDRHGELVGNVTIATNMAGRGTDIKPNPQTFYDLKSAPAADGIGGDYVLEQRGTKKNVTIPGVSKEQLKTGDWDTRLNHLQLEPDAKQVGGLHVIATERHTARRIDNQLRGRAGRQGDAGSSRFYVSLQDDLMKMFAGEWTIKVLGFLGMEEGMAIEDKRISKGILRAQKKVEERNYLSRKNLLDYDDVMDAQRSTFYGMRQQVLEGRDVPGVIWGMIGDAIKDAVDKFMTKDFVAATLAEWARSNFDVNLDPGELKGKRDVRDLEHYIKTQARAEAETNIGSTLGEFAGEDETDTKTWDAKGLSSWAMSRFRVQLSQSQIRKSTPQEIEEQLRDAAVEQIDSRDLSTAMRYLEPLFAESELAAWARDKFGIELTGQEIAETGGKARVSPADSIRELIETRARAAYARRDVEYPIEHVLTYAFGGPEGTTDNPYAVEFVRGWARSKYGVDLPAEMIRNSSVRQLHSDLCKLQEDYAHGDRLKQDLDKIMSAGTTEKEQLAAFNDRFRLGLTEDAFKPGHRPPAVLALLGESNKEDGPTTAHTGPAETDVRTTLTKIATAHIRRELTDLEQFVLIQIFDQTWKDHLYAMDMLKSGIGLQAFAEQDPRVLYKKEGYEYFQQMMAGIRDRVTDLIFRARVTGEQPQAKSNYRETAATHDTGGGYGVAEALTEIVGEPVPEPTGSGGAAVATKPIVREADKVGRNDLCPCGSGKKYKKCCGAAVA